MLKNQMNNEWNCIYPVQLFYSIYKYILFINRGIFIAHLQEIPFLFENNSFMESKKTH